MDRAVELAARALRRNLRDSGRAPLRNLPKAKVRSLILQCSDDVIAPRELGDYMRQHLPNSTLRVIENIGHCPHLSAPRAISSAMREFLPG